MKDLVLLLAILAGYTYLSHTFGQSESPLNYVPIQRSVEYFGCITEPYKMEDVAAKFAQCEKDHPYVKGQ